MTDLVWWDQHVSLQVYKMATGSSVVMGLARTVNLLVDDAPFIALLSFGWLGTLGARATGALDAESCLPDAFNELYLRFLMWTVTESCLKLLLQKQRPGHFHRTSSNVGIALNEMGAAAGRGSPSRLRGRQGSRDALPLKGVMIPGDQFSLPSGHSLRAFACARVLISNPLLSTEFGVAALFGPDGGNGATVLLCLAALVAWARVALGKHSVLDCVAGSLLGVAMVDLFEPWLGDEGRWAYQQLCLSYFTAIGLHCIVDLTRKTDQTDWLGLRAWFGFIDTAHQVAFVAGPVTGSWIFAVGSSATCAARSH